jgi:uncharacterized protein YodC (DUF2158 family)
LPTSPGRREFDLLAGGSYAGFFVKNGATQMSFKVGDTVRLKSGSPVMTVIKVQPDDTSESNVACAWFSGDEEAHNGEFPGAALEMEEDETEGDEEEEEEEEEGEEGEDEDEEEEEDDDEKEEKKGKGKKEK